MSTNKSEHVYRTELNNEFFAHFERIDNNPNKLDWWNSFASEEYAYGLKRAECADYRVYSFASAFKLAISSFIKCLDIALTRKNELWVAYITHSTLVSEQNVVMCVTVSTNDSSPFALHFGIFRCSRWFDQTNSPKHLALTLHAFAAYCVHTHLRRPVTWFLSSPMRKMRQLLLDDRRLHVYEPAFGHRWPKGTHTVQTYFIQDPMRINEEFFSFDFVIEKNFVTEVKQRIIIEARHHGVKVEDCRQFAFMENWYIDEEKPLMIPYDDLSSLFVNIMKRSA